MTLQTDRFSLDAYSLHITSDAELPGFRPLAPQPVAADVRLEVASEQDLDEAWEGDGKEVWSTSFFDGTHPFSVRVGAAQDHLFAYGTARFHLSAQADRLLWSRGGAPPPDWRRQFLDTVLHSVALVRGGVAIHASAVELDGAAVAIVSASGSGKTTLAAQLIRRGGRLLSDDILFLSSMGDVSFGHPGPPLMNLPAGTEIEDVTTELERYADPAETWVSVARVSDGPVRLGAIFFLHRGEQHSGVQARALAPSPLPVLAHLLGFPHLPGEAARFHAAADLAATTPMYDLETDLATTPAELAGLVERTAPLDSARRTDYS